MMRRGKVKLLELQQVELLGETRSSQISVLFPHVYSTADPDNQPPRQVVGVEAGGVVGDGDEGRRPWR